MPERRLTYPEWKIESGLKYGGDVRVVLRVPGSKFGGVTVFLTAWDAENLARELDEASGDSLDALEAERAS
jgi:hypothetical protein